MSTTTITSKVALSNRVYFFDEGDCKDQKLLGAKGAGLCELTQLGLPVPPGFVITTEACRSYYENGKRLPEGLMDQVRKAIDQLEGSTGKKFGGRLNPLLVSVRYGAAASLPGMMDTILNVGLNDESVLGLADEYENERFAYDAYRRFIQLFGNVVLGIDEKFFSHKFEENKKKAGARKDSQLDAESLKEIVAQFKSIVEGQTGKTFPTDPYLQVESAIAAIFNSWNGRRCAEYLNEFKIDRSRYEGSAVSIVSMVFGNLGEDSATGVVFTRDPGTGERLLYGEYLTNAQGPDVIAGIRTPKPIWFLKREMPHIFQHLLQIGEKLERQLKEPQDIEFTVERGRLYLLEAKTAKMSTQALVRTYIDMTKEGILTKDEAILRVKPQDLEQFFHRRINPNAKLNKIATGINASPGATSGKVVFTADEARSRSQHDEKVILVREETKPDDIHGFFAAQGVLTSRGGKTSHAVVVMRGMGKPCVVGCSEIEVDASERRFVVGGLVVREGDAITIDGTTGNVYLGEVPTIEPEAIPELAELLAWADQFRQLGIRANADSPEAARLARRFGAEGIGICRTERMFNTSDRLPIFVDMILADTQEERTRCLDKIVPLQKEDFKEILRAMEGYPVTIRLLDAPLHEFLPRAEELQNKIESSESTHSDGDQLARLRKTLDRVKSLSERNPMLGHRGVRLGLTYPEIYERQVRAVFEATAELMREGIRVRPQIMLPDVAIQEELLRVKRLVDKVKDEVEERFGFEIPIKYGTILEIVRACLIADELAEVADFFSFGTNDLTQATFSFSREDAERKFLPFYIDVGVLPDNPFQTLDTGGVSKLIEIAVRLGRTANPDLEIGICGEHGGDADSIQFFHTVGLSYVSCSPYRIPIARLAAAHASLKAERVILRRDVQRIDAGTGVL